MRFTTNHDESAWHATPISTFNGIDGALSASVATIFHDGVPLIYSSQEVGQAANVPFFSNTAIDWSQNPAMLDQYKTMLQFYASSDAARTGTCTEYPDQDILHFKKSKGNDEMMVIVNTRDRVVNYTLPSLIQNTSWEDVMSGSQRSLGLQVDLAPYEFLILD